MYSIIKGQIVSQSVHVKKIQLYQYMHMIISMKLHETCFDRCKNQQNMN